MRTAVKKRIMGVDVSMGVRRQCGCVNLNDGGITFCRLHSAASDLLAACKAATKILNAAWQAGDINVRTQDGLDAMNAVNDAIVKASEKPADGTPGPKSLSKMFQL